MKNGLDNKQLTCNGDGDVPSPNIACLDPAAESAGGDENVVKLQWKKTTRIEKKGTQKPDQQNVDRACFSTVETSNNESHKYVTFVVEGKELCVEMNPNHMRTISYVMGRFSTKLLADCFGMKRIFAVVHKTESRTIVCCSDTMPIPGLVYHCVPIKEYSY